MILSVVFQPQKNLLVYHIWSEISKSLSLTGVQSNKTCTPCEDILNHIQTSLVENLDQED